MNRNRLGDELGETNKWFRSMLVDDDHWLRYQVVLVTIYIYASCSNEMIFLAL